MNPQSMLNAKCAASARRGTETNVFVKVKYRCAANGAYSRQFPLEYSLGSPQFGVRRSLGIERLASSGADCTIKSPEQVKKIAGSDEVRSWSERKAACPNHGRPLQPPRTRMVLYRPLRRVSFGTEWARRCPN